MFEGEVEGLGDFLDVIGIELSAKGSDDFGDGGSVGAGDGDAAGHRFKGGQAKTFVEARQHYQGGEVIYHRQVLLIEPASEADLVLDIKFVGDL